MGSRKSGLDAYCENCSFLFSAAPNLFDLRLHLVTTGFLDSSTYGCGSRPIGIGALLILGPILVGIESDVHWGLSDLAFDPWPYCGFHQAPKGARVTKLLNLLTPQRRASRNLEPAPQISQSPWLRYPLDGNSRADGFCDSFLAAFKIGSWLARRFPYLFAQWSLSVQALQVAEHVDPFFQLEMAAFQKAAVFICRCVKSKGQAIFHRGSRPEKVPLSPRN